MADQPAILSLLALGVFSIVLAVIGIRRGKAVTIYKHSRETSPRMFWYSIVLQLGLGVAGFVLAVTKVFK